MSRLGYFSIGLVTFLVVIILFAPARLIFVVAGEDIKQALPDLRFSPAAGTVWQGETRLRYREFPIMTATWSLDALPLFAGNAATTVNLEADGLTASFEGEFAYEGGAIEDLNADISSSYINQVTLDYGLDLSGEFSLDDVDIQFDRRWLTNLHGELSWPGGIVHIETPKQIYTANLPALNGELSFENNEAILAVTTAGEPLIDVRLKSDGWAAVGVHYAFMEIANLPLPGGSEDSDTGEPAVLLEEKLF